MNDFNILTPGNALTISASSTEPGQGFALLMNVSRIVGASELELIPGHTLRKATFGEIAIIKEILIERGARLHGYFVPWEMEDQGGGQFDTAPEEDWNYFVIAFSGTNARVDLLEQAFVLLDSNLRIGFTVSFSQLGRGTILHAGKFFQAVEESRFALMANSMDKYLSSVDAEHAAQIGQLARQLSQHAEADIDITKVSQQLRSLQALDANSDVAFLGYFSVLESLLIHKPDPKDPNDSITRQMKKKITLLNNRWTPKLDYSAFASLQPEGVWVKMYEVRSAFAHGGAPDFKNSLKSLGSVENARSLLVRTVRAVARQALQEPRLVADLREC